MAANIDDSGLSRLDVTTDATVGRELEDNTTPSGAVGSDADRDKGGRFRRGNRAAMVTGSRSAAFWEAHEAVRREIASEAMADKGFAEIAAPVALRLATDTIAQVTIVQRSAFARVIEAGGPLTSEGRTRRAFTVWLQATDRLERYLRLVGLDRAPKPAATIEEYLAKRATPVDGAPRA